MRSVSFLVFCSLGLMAPVLAWAQGTFTGDTVIEAPVELPVGVPVEETLDERIARLKRELREAEQEAKALREAAAQEKRAEREAATPSSALVIVMAAEGGGGSGFIAELRGRPFLVTNIHVLAAARGARFETLDGQQLVLPETVFVSRRRDVAIVPISWTGELFKVSQSLSFDEVAIGDRISVMGNSDGVQVATRLRGEIDAIGPSELEISAKFVPGNSGSPIVHNTLARVIGVVSHMRDLSVKNKWTQDSELADIRRYGFRLDGEIRWQQVALAELWRQWEIYQRFEDRTGVLAKTIYMLANERRVMTNYSSHESLGHLFEPFESGFSWERGLTSSNNILKLQRFTKRLHSELVTDRDPTREELTVDFLLRRYQDADIVRDYFMEELEHLNF